MQDGGQRYLEFYYKCDIGPHDLGMTITNDVY